jgi:hypothetical protein
MLNAECPLHFFNKQITQLSRRADMPETSLRYGR